MLSPKMMNLLICVGCLISAFDSLSLYGLSYMQIPALLSLTVMFICLIYFYDHLFSCIWSCITAIIIFVPACLAVFEQTTNYKAIVIDCIFSFVLMILLGSRLFIKMTSKKSN